MFRRSVSSVYESSVYECQSVECAFTSPVIIELGMLVMYCMQFVTFTTTDIPSTINTHNIEL